VDFGIMTDLTGIKPPEGVGLVSLQLAVGDLLGL
jgi:hypothetical protein